MCIQSYYNHQRGEEEIELDLLSEIKNFGIDKWNREMEEKTKRETSRITRIKKKQAFNLVKT